MRQISTYLSIATFRSQWSQWGVMAASRCHHDEGDGLIILLWGTLTRLWTNSFYVFFGFNKTDATLFWLPFMLLSSFYLESCWYSPADRNHLNGCMFLMHFLVLAVVQLGELMDLIVSLLEVCHTIWQKFKLKSCWNHLGIYAILLVWGWFFLQSHDHFLPCIGWV
jgi:hypothetical protein